MNKWTYTLGRSAIQLRELIKEGNQVKIIKHLQSLCSYIQTIILDEDKEYYADEIQELTDILVGEDEIILGGITELEKYGWGNATELIDERLSMFYDLCDDIGIWVDM